MGYLDLTSRLLNSSVIKDAFLFCVGVLVQWGDSTKVTESVQVVLMQPCLRLTRQVFILLSMGLIDSSNQLMSNAKHCLYISVGHLGRCAKLQSKVRVFCFVLFFSFFVCVQRQPVF